MGKNWLKSKTLWFNVLGLAAGLFGVDGPFGHVFTEQEVAIGLGIGNMVLRGLTNEPLAGTVPKQ